MSRIVSFTWNFFARRGIKSKVVQFPRDQKKSKGQTKVTVNGRGQKKLNSWSFRKTCYLFLNCVRSLFRKGIHVLFCSLVFGLRSKINTERASVKQRGNPISANYLSHSTSVFSPFFLPFPQISPTSCPDCFPLPRKISLSAAKSIHRFQISHFLRGVKRPRIQDFSRLLSASAVTFVQVDQFVFVRVFQCFCNRKRKWE